MREEWENTAEFLTNRLAGKHAELQAALSLIQTVRETKLSASNFEEAYIQAVVARERFRNLMEREKAKIDDLAQRNEDLRGLVDRVVAANTLLVREKAELKERIEALEAALLKDAP